MTAAFALSGWTVLAVLGCLAMHRARRAATPTPPTNWTDLTLSQPPVPTQADVDATWATDWQSDVEPADIDTLEQRVFDRLFADQIAAEGLQ